MLPSTDISPSTYVTAERRTEDRGHTQFNMMDYRTGLLLLTVCWAACQCPSLCKVNFLTVCYKDLISCCQLQQKKRSSIRSPSTPTMFSVALLLLLAAGSCESH
ncbi:hypothetical protein F7725_003638 [Dissostichus mawsoni]|uniref:Uncharacterized protein n=1 Tax=Dissostichus mawsoni TaxID=36200 RepID=A0A7J5YAV8_DISMA|nr:hypothetical protein F7725_003638 [Dissostichus mawsoni]